MFIWTTRLSRKKAVFSIIIMGIVMAVLIILTAKSDQETAVQPQLADNTQRVAYLESLGWKVIPDPLETLQFRLPETLEEPYLTYNELQKTQGFDLSSYCGKQVSRYTYTVTNYPNRPDGIHVNLYVCDNLPVAGDIFCPGTNGFQESLYYPASDA